MIKLYPNCEVRIKNIHDWIRRFIIASHNNYILPIFASVIAYLTSLIIVKFDLNFNWRWTAFGMYMLCLLLITFTYLKQTITFSNSKNLLSISNWIPIIILLILSIIINFSFLSTYPFIGISDSLRDGAFYASQITNGNIKNIFTYGDRNSYGNIIPTLVCFFYQILGNTILTERIPAALLGTADVILTYLLVCKLRNKQTAFWSALTLATLQFHIYFSRAEVVNAFNSFWTVVLLLNLYVFMRKRRSIDYLFLGTLVGFVYSFHPAVRVFALLVTCIFICLEFYSTIFKKQSFIKTLKNTTVFLLFSLIGFGPLIINTNLSNFFHIDRVPLINKTESEISYIKLTEVKKIKDNYIQSLKGFFSEPIAFHVHIVEPLLTKVLFIFFLIGIIYSFFILKNSFLNILFFMVLILPFTNSAITDQINNDSRLTPLYSITAIFIGLGFNLLIHLSKIKIWRIFCSLIIISYLIYGVILVFITNKLNVGMPSSYFLLTHAFYIIQDKENTTLHSAKSSDKKIFLFMSPENFNYYDAGVNEQILFFLPNLKLEQKIDNHLNDNEIYITEEEDSAKTNYNDLKETFTISCLSGREFICPVNYKGKLIIHY